jgi:hypothetical protein
MTILNNRHIIGFLAIIVMFLLVVSFITITASYFNSQEIGSASTQCYENGGKVILEIHNNFTNKYSFECK